MYLTGNSRNITQHIIIRITIYMHTACLDRIWTVYICLVPVELTGLWQEHKLCKMNLYNSSECFRCAAHMWVFGVNLFHCCKFSALFLLLRFLVTAIIQFEALQPHSDNQDVPFLYTLPVPSSFCIEGDWKTAECYYKISFSFHFLSEKSNLVLKIVLISTGSSGTNSTHQQ